MPFWLSGALGVLGKHIPRILIYGFIILGIGFLLYSAFLKPTNSTTIGAGGKLVNIYHSSDFDIIPLIGCSAWRLNVKSYYQKPPSQNQQNIENKNEESFMDKIAFWRKI